MRVKKKDKKFYDFEAMALLKLIGMKQTDNYLSEDEVKSLIEKISRSYQILIPQIKYTRIDSGSCYYRKMDHTIYLNKRYGFTLLFVLHELCHPITHKLYPNHKESHGEEFVSVWIEVMSRMFDVDPQEFKNLAQESGIKFLENSSLFTI